MVRGVGGEDVVAAMVEEWRRERPDLDPTPMALFGLLTRADVLAGKRIAAGLATAGVNRGEFDVLATLRRAGTPYARSAGALAQSLLLSPGAMTNRLDKLEGMGLITRTVDPDDRRSVRIALTRSGRRLVDEATTRHVENLAEMLAGLRRDERDELSVLLGRLLSSLESPAHDVAGD